MPGRASGTPASQNQRTADPYSLIWSIAWLAPVPRNSGGRSAVSTSSGTPDASASITAGWKLAAAVPEVHSAATGRPLALARPRARNAAERSSIRTCSRRSPAAARSHSAIASGALRDPGASTASRSPHRRSSSARTVPSAVDGFTEEPRSPDRGQVARGGLGALAPGSRIRLVGRQPFGIHDGAPDRQLPSGRG